MSEATIFDKKYKIKEQDGRKYVDLNLLLKKDTNMSTKVQKILTEEMPKEEQASCCILESKHTWVTETFVRLYLFKYPDKFFDKDKIVSSFPISFESPQSFSFLSNATSIPVSASNATQSSNGTTIVDTSEQLRGVNKLMQDMHQQKCKLEREATAGKFDNVERLVNTKPKVEKVNIASIFRLSQDSEGNLKRSTNSHRMQELGEYKSRNAMHIMKSFFSAWFALSALGGKCLFLILLAYFCSYPAVFLWLLFKFLENSPKNKEMVLRMLGAVNNKVDLYLSPCKILFWKELNCVSDQVWSSFSCRHINH